MMHRVMTLFLYDYSNEFLIPGASCLCFLYSLHSLYTNSHDCECNYEHIVNVLVKQDLITFHVI